ncbi:nuclease HARBI1 [Marchantia polymorpha subsp. ruderalis]|nr:hypothetical protein Mp_2g14130 [Marchantia polymorpha subsp. ruderalis]
MDELDASLMSVLEGRVSAQNQENDGGGREMAKELRGRGGSCAEAGARGEAATDADARSVRKRKLAVFAAAGAVVAIQTVLVAVPEIWQPLDDDESVERAAYQEGLHSWFGALNRAAWVLSASSGGGGGGWWVKPRSGVWFNTFLMNSHDDDRWLEALHMRRRTFLWVANSLEVHVRKQDTKWRPSIPVTVRVGATIYRLVKGADYYEVADKFGIGESSVHEIIGDCVPAIVKVFGHHVSFPRTAAGLARVSQGFQQLCGLPNCHGALDSCHVEIINPSGPDVKHYCNRTGHFSIVLQAVCDTSFAFLDVFCGFPGSASHAKVLHNSGLLERASAGNIVTAGPVLPINGGFQLRPYFLASAEFPLCPWLLPPFDRCGCFFYSDAVAPPSSPARLSYAQEQFNAHHERGRQHATHALSVLKGVFRVLGNGIRGRLELAPTIVHACCILYNIMIRRKDLDVKSMVLELLRSQQRPDEDVGNGHTHLMQHVEHFASPETLDDASGLEVRNQLAEFLVWDG